MRLRFHNLAFTPGHGFSRSTFFHTWADDEECELLLVRQAGHPGLPAVFVLTRTWLFQPRQPACISQLRNQTLLSGICAPPAHFALLFHSEPDACPVKHFLACHIDPPAQPSTAATGQDGITARPCPLLPRLGTKEQACPNSPMFPSFKNHSGRTFLAGCRKQASQSLRSLSPMGAAMSCSADSGKPAPTLCQMSLNPQASPQAMPALSSTPFRKPMLLPVAVFPGSPCAAAAPEGPNSPARSRDDCHTTSHRLRTSTAGPWGACLPGRAVMTVAFPPATALDNCLLRD